MIFLKYDRLQGKGWAGLATANGISSAPLTSLLAEIAATGSHTFYVDGIDRIEREHRPIVLDVLRAILTSQSLANWKIVVSLRDAGIEPLRNWLGEILDKMSIGTVEVGALDHDEASALAKSKPSLRALLFGTAQVREIVRRPFFAKILSQSYSAEASGPPFEPKSEVDLIENWWLRGGYNATGQEAIERQRAIVDIGAARARQLSQPVRLNRLQMASVAQIERLVGDGILQHANPGHTVRFSHDIFFEWAFFHVLSDSGDKWLEEIRRCGEPPAVGRIVELLSQWEYRQGGNWGKSLNQFASAGMRPQWLRAWLLGPVGAAIFEANEEEFTKAITANEFALLKKAIVWFQAEKTTPNANILAGDLPKDQRIRIADFLSWPSDLAAWRRFIGYLLARVETIPASLYPGLVSILEVWQNALLGVPNPVSTAFLKQCAIWLREIDERADSAPKFERSRFDQIDNQGEFRRSISRLILRSTSSEPALTEEYLRRVIGSKRLRSEKFKEIIDFSPTLANTHPDLLVDLALKHLREELPDERVRREREQNRRAAEMRNRALAKPEAERTREDNLVIDGTFSILGVYQFSYHDWEALSIERDTPNFWPPSPLREPFHSLFKSAPSHALKLFSALCNHAVEAWRQLHRHDRERPGSPIALEIQFPWGVQEFWGGDREYLWHRAMWAPDAIECGFMALEEWCFAELARGRQVDDLIRQVVEGNQSIAILGVASILALHTERVSETVFPIITAQRLWFADFNRMVQESSGAALMGFRPGEETHFEAVKAASVRPVRQRTLQWLAPLYVFSRDFGDRTKKAILAFKDNLPYQIEEHKKIKEARDGLMKRALEYEELARVENYRARKVADKEGMVEVVHVSPSASKPENVKKLEKANLVLQEGNLWAWASKVFENGKLEDPSKVPAAIEIARKLDDKTLFKSATDQERMGMRQGAVAATAAVILQFREDRDAKELAWARDVLARSAKAPEMHDKSLFPQSVIPWHHGIFVARGLASEVRNDAGDAATPDLLLALVSHPLEIVSLAALEQITSLWSKNPKLVWAALLLAFDLCRIEPLSAAARRGVGDSIHSSGRIRDALRAAADYYERGAGWPDLPLPPPAWIKSKRKSSSGEGPDFEFDKDDVENTSESWTGSTTHWYQQYAAKVLQRVPFEAILKSQAKGSLLAFVAGVLEWTNAKNSPPWLKKGRRDRESTRLLEWTHQLGETLGRISGLSPSADVDSRFLKPIFALEGDTCWALLAPFSSSYICRYVYDAKTVPEGAVEVIGLCLKRFLDSSTFDRDSYRAGEFHGFDEPRLAEILMFVSVERALGAARFANGDWSGISLILPLVDRFIRAGAWSARVMSHFVTLCERAKSSYPSELFADQVLSTIGDGFEPSKGWSEALIPARIASLVQYFADRDTPMSQALGQKLLRVLDLLVDMGDRRSAALQLSETFREITIA